MAKTMLELVMSEDLQDRIAACAKTQGKTIQEFIQEALYTYVEDIEDGAMADVALAEEGLIFLTGEGDANGALDHSLFVAGRKTA